MNAAAATRVALAGRTAAALFGGYAFTWGFNALGVALLFAAGWDLHDAEGIVAVLGFLLFTWAFLWAFAARSQPRVWLVLGGGALAMTVGASLVQRLLLGSP